MEIYFGTDIEDYFYEVKNFFFKKDIYMIKNKKLLLKSLHFLCLTKYAKKSLKKGASS